MNWFWKLLGYRSLEPEAIDEKHQLKSPLSEVRKKLAKHNIGIYVVLEQDEHESEYVADADRRIRFISGFTGSAATVTISSDWAELATDSRYHLIAEKQLSKEWRLRKLGLPGVGSWEDALVKHAISQRVNVGVDPRLINASMAKVLGRKLSDSGLRLIPIFENLIDEVWYTKPLLSREKIVSLGLEYTGRQACDKIAELRRSMEARGAQTFITFSLEEIAWVLNLRGGDIPYVPVFKSFLVVTTKDIILFADVQKITVNVKNHEGIKIQCHRYDQFWASLNKFSPRIWIPNGGSWGMILGISETAKKSLITDQSPLNIAKAVKNSVEIKGIRESQLKCCLSIVRYLAWLSEKINDNITEYDGALKLLEIRKQLPDFMGNSFETISSTGPNASAPHYSPEPKGSAIIRRDQVYLLDSGSHFLQGSTDITRTVHYGEPTEEEITAYTLVLKGQLAVSSSVFPEGTSGFKLDILARQFLWQRGLDYGHGTGHGIGSYLNIHELPLGLGLSSGPESFIMEHHFVSDEPGYYKDNNFGIRLENDILAVKAFDEKDASISEATKKYLTFEIMTLVPYEPKLIDASLLTHGEKEILNNYHQKCRESLRPYLKEPRELKWLQRCTQKIE